jgi:hypothetical protein
MGQYISACLYDLYMLTKLYFKDKRIGQIVDETDISILPLLNPDSYEEDTPGSCSRTAGMLNARGKDLDQDFPT